MEEHLLAILAKQRGRTKSHKRRQGTKAVARVIKAKRLLEHIAMRRQVTDWHQHRLNQVFGADIAPNINQASAFVIWRLIDEKTKGWTSAHLLTRRNTIRRLTRRALRITHPDHDRQLAQAREKAPQAREGTRRKRHRAKAKVYVPRALTAHELEAQERRRERAIKRRLAREQAETRSPRTIWRQERLSVDCTIDLTGLKTREAIAEVLLSRMVDIFFGVCARRCIDAAHSRTLQAGRGAIEMAFLPLEREAHEKWLEAGIKARAPEVPRLAGLTKAQWLNTAKRAFERAVLRVLAVNNRCALFVAQTINDQSFLRLRAQHGPNGLVLSDHLGACFLVVVGCAPEGARLQLVPQA